MKAVVCRHAELDVVDRPEPEPGPGQVRLEVLRCGICGSDLHARHGLDDWADLAQRAGYDRFGRSDEPVVFGHEFCGELAEYGPGCKRDVATGAPVVALPLIRAARGVDTVGLSMHAPGAYAEQVIAQESLTLAVPTALDPTSRR
jgi:threonine dehydrogenase-like Zn-dependent dehydrogenase